MPGRTSRRTPERRARLIAALLAGNTRRAACAVAGLSTDTLRRWLADDAELAEEVKRAEGQAEAALVARIVAASRQTWTAAAWLLERRWPESYARRERVDARVEHAADGLALGQAAAALAADLSPAELARLYQERIRGGSEPFRWSLPSAGPGAGGEA